MITPVLKDEAILADVAEARRDWQDLHLWWLGQSGFLVQWQNRHLLLDPYLSDSLTKVRPHGQTARAHDGAVVAPERLDFIDVVSSSHNHTDHLDPETLGPLLRANPKLGLIIPEAHREFVADRRGMVTDIPIGLDVGESATVAGFKFHAVPAAHELTDKDDQGRCRYLGYVIEFGPWTIYHSGDTVRYSGMAESLRNWRIDIALLPINGRAPEKRVAGNLTGREAAVLAKEIQAALVIPCHYEMFEFNTASPAEFVETALQLRQPQQVLRCGERWTSGLHTVGR